MSLDVRRMFRADGAIRWEVYDCATGETCPEWQDFKSEEGARDSIPEHLLAQAPAVTVPAARHPYPSRRQVELV
jgi:hypothetical protein